MYSKFTVLVLMTTVLGMSMVNGDYAGSVNSAIKKLLGLNCIADVIVDLEDSAADFMYNVKSCGSQAEESVITVTSAIQEELYPTTNRTLSVNDNVCSNGGYRDDLDAKKSSSNSCVTYMNRQMTKLETLVDDTNTAVTGLIAGATLSACTTMAATKFQMSLGNFETLITTCGTLADTLAA